MPMELNVRLVQLVINYTKIQLYVNHLVVLKIPIVKFVIQAHYVQFASLALSDLCIDFLLSVFNAMCHSAKVVVKTTSVLLVWLLTP